MHSSQTTAGWTHTLHRMMLFNVTLSDAKEGDNRLSASENVI